MCIRDRGTTVFNMKTNGFDFHQGPIFADIVLVDEINRAPAKTQAALFEVMEERQISIDGTTHRMGDLYTILATQNPVEQEGTYKLPEAQLDRFLMKITMDYPSLEAVSYTHLIPLSVLNSALVTELATLTKEHPGNTELYFKVTDDADVSHMSIDLISRPIKLSVGRDLITYLKERPELGFHIN